MTANVQLAKDFISAAEEFTLDRAVADRLLHPEFSQTEYPNLLNRNGQVRNLFKKAYAIS